MFLRGMFFARNVFVKDLLTCMFSVVSFRFVSKYRKISNAVGMSSLITSRGASALGMFYRSLYISKL